MTKISLSRELLARESGGVVFEVKMEQGSIFELLHYVLNSF